MQLCKKTLKKYQGFTFMAKYALPWDIEIEELLKFLSYI